MRILRGAVIGFGVTALAATGAGAQDVVITKTDTPTEKVALNTLVGPELESRRIDIAEVDRRASALMKQRGMVGLSLAVIDDGEIVFSKGYGRTQRGSRERVTDQTVFRWASVSKSIAAATTLKVADEGAFDLSTPVEDLLGDVLPSESDGVTVEHVLSHQTGLPRNAFDRKVEDGQGRKRIKRNLLQVDAVCAPGRCHSYQNVAYDLAADVVEASVGLPYKAVVNARIFKPLGMETASLSLEGLRQSKSWARPHNSSGAPYRSVKPTYYRVPAAAGVNSSSRDLAKWVVANMEPGGEVVPDAMQDAMQVARTRTLRRQRQLSRKWNFLSNASYGLGWRIYDYRGGNTVVAHRGAVQGFRASVIFDPATQDGVVMLWNSNSSRPNGLAYEIMDQSYGLKKTDWLRMNAPRARATITAARKSKPKPKTKVLTAAALPETAAEPGVLTDADIAKLRAAEEERMMAESLAATCPCPEDTQELAPELLVSGSDE